VEEDISKLSRENCISKGHFWDRVTCKPLTLDNVMKSDIGSFCAAAKGDIKHKGSAILFGDGIRLALNTICGFDAIHIANDRDTTEWAPNIPKMMDATGSWYIDQLAKQAKACSKNDTEEVIGDFDDIKKIVLEELTKEEKKQLKKGELDLDELVTNRINGDMEFSCSDIWDAIRENENEGLTGDWSGDTRDQYDLGETEWLFTDENANKVWQNEEDIDFEEQDAVSTFPDIGADRILMPLVEEQENHFVRRFNESAYALNELLNIVKTDSFVKINTNSIEILPTTKTSEFNINENRKVTSVKDVFPSVNKQKREEPNTIDLRWFAKAEDKEYPEPIPDVLKINDAFIHPTTRFAIDSGEFKFIHNGKAIKISDKRWSANVNKFNSLMLKDTRVLW
jgi:hypothetical protein